MAASLSATRDIAFEVVQRDPDLPTDAMVAKLTCLDPSGDGLDRDTEKFGHFRLRQ